MDSISGLWVDTDAIKEITVNGKKSFTFLVYDQNEENKGKVLNLILFETFSSEYEMTLIKYSLTEKIYPT